MTRSSDYPACLCRPDASGRVQTRSEETEQRYRARYEGMVRTYCHRHHVDVVECADLAEEAGHKSKSLSAKTLTQYHAAIRQHLRDCWDESGVDIKEVERIDALLRDQRSLVKAGQASAEQKNRTSAGRAKSMTELELMMLVTKLLEHPTRIRQIAVGLLEHSVQLATRPSEFLSIREVSEGHFVVPSAKFSPENGRGLQPFRVVPTDDYEPADLIDLRHVIDLIELEHAEGATTASLLRRCQHAIREARKSLPGRNKKIAPYTGRQQARANLAATGAPPEDVAVVMGHASADTAQSHYSPARRAWPGAKAKPAPKVDPTLAGKVRPARPSRGWNRGNDNTPKPK